MSLENYRVYGISLLTTGKEIKVMTILIFQSKHHHNQVLIINSYMCLSLSTLVLNSRDRQGMYGMQHFRTPRNAPHNRP